MKRLLDRFDALRLLALGCGLLPLALLPALGLLWLWQNQQMLPWLGGMAGCAAAGFVLDRWLDRRARARLKLDASGPQPHWPPSEQAAWTQVEALADGLDPADWPLGDSERLLQLGRQTIDGVARHYHAEAEHPLWEISVPHLLRIIELAARDLGREVREQVPFSERVTIGDLLTANRWRERLQGVFQPWRAGRPVFNPAQALLREASEHLQGQALGAVQQDLQRWLLREYVRRTGRYAIEVYSGRLRFGDDDPLAQLSEQSAEDLAAEPAPAEPLRILIIGQTNAGKSSLVNALCGGLQAAVDALPATGALRAYRLEREGFTAALLSDTPGLDDFPPAERLAAARTADLILWVCAAHRADRAAERQALDALRAEFAAHPERHPPPILLVLAHIDRLRPREEWAPPYDLRETTRPKARNIAEAVAAVAEDLALAPAEVIPVCLAEGRRYNVDDALWAAILERQSAADRVRTLRCLDTARQGEQRELLWKQLRNAGRVLVEWPQRWH